MADDPDKKPQQLEYRSGYEPPEVDDLSRMYRKFFAEVLIRLGLGFIILTIVIVLFVALFGLSAGQL